VSDLVAFLSARLDEDEQAAKAATNETGRWTWDHGLGEQCNDPECPYGSLLDQASESDTYAGTVLMDAHGYDVKAPWQGADHIARHDPARVLREVEAKRRIIHAHDRPHECLALTGSGEHSVVDGQPWELWEPTHTADHGPCLVLRLLALPYADHPDYREEWKP
jgi:hypothetical protein